VTGVQTCALPILTWIFIQSPDFSLQAFLHQYGMSDLPFPPVQFIPAIFISTITFAPFLNAIPAFGEEFGWRGYLLPKLLPLGTKKALLLSGLIWGLWHAPIVLMGFKYGNFGVPGVLFFSILVMFIGVYIGYMRIISGSVILAAFVHGVFNAQAYGVWTLLFPSVNPLLGGLTGLTGILIFSILGFWVFRQLNLTKRM
jgi:membrane protease YdiL (CAAX protease family)